MFNYTETTNMGLILYIDLVKLCPDYGVKRVSNILLKGHPNEDSIMISKSFGSQ